MNGSDRFVVPFARVVRLLAFATWMGSLIFFGAVVAPKAVSIFGTGEQFAEFIARSIFTLHAIGLWCGVAMILSLRMLWNRAYRIFVQMALVFVMMLLTYCSNRFIVVPMERDRQAAGGNISVLIAGSPLREDFNTRHAWSTRIEEGVLLSGLALAVLIGMEAGLREKITTTPPQKLFDLS